MPCTIRLRFPKFQPAAGVSGSYDQVLSSDGRLRGLLASANNLVAGAERPVRQQKLFDSLNKQVTSSQYRMSAHRGALEATA
jgi:hypothetical protein